MGGDPGGWTAHLKPAIYPRVDDEATILLENNLIVTEILAAARESARTGRTVRLVR